MKINCVTGAPASGKSSYVKKHCKENDLVFDFDLCVQAFTLKDAHSDITDGQSRVINKLKFSLINISKAEEDIDNLWIISTKPSDALKDALGGDCNYINLEIDEDEAKKRVDEDDSRKDKESEYEKINKYFEKEGRAMPIRDNREYRAMVSFELRKADAGEEKSYIVEGYASTFDTYVLFEEDGIEYKEKILPEAFANTDMSDVVFLKDHTGTVFARTKNKTITLEVDEHGLKVTADLSKTASARAMFEEIENEMYTQMSFAFTVAEDFFDRKTHTRNIKDIKKLFDVSAVSFPANNYTDISIATRSRFDGFIEKERLELAEERKAIEVALAKYEFLEV